MFGKYWVPHRENLIENTELNIAEKAIQMGWSVIVDDTNLNPVYINRWKGLANSLNSEIEFKEFKVSLDEAIKRDSNRENPVGESVIRKFYNTYYE